VKQCALHKQHFRGCFCFFIAIAALLKLFRWHLITLLLIVNILMQKMEMFVVPLTSNHAAVQNENVIESKQAPPS